MELRIPKDLRDPKELRNPWELQIPQEAEHPWGFGEVQELETPYRVKHPKDLGISRSWETPGDWKPHREHHITGNLGAEHFKRRRSYKELSIAGDLEIPTASLGIWEPPWGAGEPRGN